jgi:hypothetical protein
VNVGEQEEQTEVEEPQAEDETEVEEVEAEE